MISSKIRWVCPFLVCWYLGKLSEQFCLHFQIRRTFLFVVGEWWLSKTYTYLCTAGHILVLQIYVHTLDVLLLLLMETRTKGIYFSLSLVNLLCHIWPKNGVSRKFCLMSQINIWHDQLLFSCSHEIVRFFRLSAPICMYWLGSWYRLACKI